MNYRCTRCDWSGHWDEMIHETLCPRCRGATTPLRPGEESPQQVAQSMAAAMTGAPPQ